MDRLWCWAVSNGHGVISTFLQMAVMYCLVSGQSRDIGTSEMFGHGELYIVNMPQRHLKYLILSSSWAIKQRNTNLSPNVSEWPVFYFFISLD